MNILSNGSYYILKKCMLLNYFAWYYCVDVLHDYYILACGSFLFIKNI